MIISLLLARSKAFLILDSVWPSLSWLQLVFLAVFSLINVERQAFAKRKSWIEPTTTQSGGNHADRLATAAALVPRSWVFISPTLVRVLDHEGRILFKGLKEFTKWIKIVSLSNLLFYNRFRWRSSSKTLKRDFQSCLSYQLFRFTRFETRYQTRTVRAATDVAIAPISSPGSVPQDVLEILRSQLTGKKSA